MGNKRQKQVNRSLKTMSEAERIRRERAVLRLVLLVEAAGTVDTMQRYGLFNNDLEALKLMLQLAPPSRGGLRNDPESEEDWHKLIDEGIAEYGIEFLLESRRQMDLKKESR